MREDKNTTPSHPMTVQSWAHVKNLLHQVMQLAPARRAGFLDEACGSDTALRAELESLLAAEADVRASFLESPPPGAAHGDAAGRVDTIGALAAGQIVAQRFRLIRTLGEGGMGQVWLAEQISPVRRQVALKLIKAGMYDEAVVQRFQSERQWLAIMDHPAIAKVFEAGATPQGQPYFVMEYVPGLPITEYCDQNRLGIQERLELLISACEGVQHAHRKAIIHRDLKPANILIVEVDGKPTPRIIDFGIAKATVRPVEDQVVLTRFGLFLGTPGYMSPEQVDPNIQDIDTRTDVYALGVVLYVLLTGLQPFAPTTQRQKQPLHELLRLLREEDPPNPSTKLSADRETAAATAAARGTLPMHLVRQLRGDLDWITLKALERDRARRYGAPSELAADLRRYLNHEPVVARPASAGYRFRKYIRRHRLALGVGTGLLALVTAFSVLQALELRRTTQERDRANQERDRAARITDFMAGMFKVADPSEARGNSVTAREILDKAAKDMQTGLAKDPEVRSQMMQVMARTYTNLGLFARAHDLAQRALDARQRLLGPDDPRTLESMSMLGWILDHEGHSGDGEKLDRQALEGERRVLGPEAPLTLETMDNLGLALENQGRYEEQERVERAVLEAATRKLGPENEQTLRMMKHLADALFYEARYPEADQELRRMLDIQRRVLGMDHPGTLTGMTDLALVVWDEGHLAEAEQLFREALASEERVLGRDHPYTNNTLDNLGSLLATEGHLAEAEKFSREALANRLRTLGPEHPDTMVSKINLADELLKEGDVQGAEKLQREALTTQLRVLGPENPDTLVSQTSLAKSLIREGHYAEAENLARKTLEVQVRNAGLQHPETLDTLRQLGIALAYSRRYGEASKLFGDAIEKESSSGGRGDHFSVWYAFACVAAAANQVDDALRYLRAAIGRGYRDVNALMADDELKNLRSNAAFQQLVADLKTAPAGAKTP
jgi:serine/threonine protein kinase